jgi:hypothetical protein
LFFDGINGIYRDFVTSSLGSSSFRRRFQLAPSHKSYGGIKWRNEPPGQAKNTIDD